MNLIELKKKAEAASQGEGESCYTHPRDSNNWKANDEFHQAVDAPTVLRLLKIAERAKDYLATHTGEERGQLGAYLALREALEGVE